MQRDDKHNANAVPLPPDGTAGVGFGDRLGEVGVEGGGEGAFSGADVGRGVGAGVGAGVGTGEVRTMACPSPHYNATTNQTIDNGNTQQSNSTREKGEEDGTNGRSNKQTNE